MPKDSNTEILVEDGILPRFGIVTWDAIDSDEFRALKGGAGPRVYMVLALFADKGMASHPKQATIAHVTGLSRQMVNRAVGQLCAAGLLKRELVHRGHFSFIKYTLIRPQSKMAGVNRG